MWKNILDSFFKFNGFVKHQLDSYDDFMDVGIQRVLDEMPPFEISVGPESRGGPASHVVRFGAVTVKKPVIREHDGSTTLMYPCDARNRNLTYQSNVYCDLLVKTTRDGETVERTCREQLGSIPIMVKSKHCLLYKKTSEQLRALGECEYDEGGYFIVNGNEKAVIAQDRTPNNVISCTRKKNTSKPLWQAEIRSSFENRTRNPSTLCLKMHSRGAVRENAAPTFTDIEGIHVQITYIRVDVPLVMVFYAFGFTDHDEIMRVVEVSRPESMDLGDYRRKIRKFLRCSFDETRKLVPTVGKTPEEIRDFCLDFIGSNGSIPASSPYEDRLNYARQNLNHEFLPNLSFNHMVSDKVELPRNKVTYLGLIINRLFMLYTGLIGDNDRDHLANKRVDLTGDLLCSLFKNIFKKMYKDIRNNLVKCFEAGNNIDQVNNIKSKSITNDIKFALSTGNWNRQAGFANQKVGVAQRLDRYSYSSSLSHLRRLNTPLNREGKQVRPRQLHSTHFGYLCPSETPEGQGCGLLKNFAVTCHVSRGSEQTSVFLEKYFARTLKDYDIELGLAVFGIPESAAGQSAAGSPYKLFLDGSWRYVVPEFLVEEFVETIRGFRTRLTIAFDTSICLNREQRTLVINTGPGRLCRPLIRASALDILRGTEKTKDFEWTRLLTSGVVEYVDVQESEETLIAMFPEQVTDRHTHVEIHPSVMLGVCASAIPFPDHNQSPRNIYQASMGKQAMGIYLSNYTERFDTLGYVLHSPQRPLVGTEVMKHLRTTELPSGLNAIVAIACSWGYNQEDSIIMNQAAVDRGLFRSTFYRTYVDQEKEIIRVGGLMEQFEVPDKSETKGIQHGNYGKLDSDGIICPGSRVVENDIIIGKTTPLAANRQELDGLKKFKKRDISTSIRQNEVGVVDKVILTTNSDGHKYTKVKVRSIRVPEIGDKFCLTADHDVLTDQGFVPINLVTREHAVAGLRIVDGAKKLVFERPTEVVSFPHTGDMYQVEAAGVSLLATMNHRFFTSDGDGGDFEITEARDIVGKRRRYLSVCDGLHTEFWNQDTEVHHQRFPGDVPAALRMTSEEFSVCQVACMVDGFTARAPGADGIYALTDDFEVTHPLVNAEGATDDAVVPFSGTVYCCTVPSGLMYVRRNGKCVWTGNSSRHGQKGTIGMVYRQEDMPFTEDGIVPDIIINPHAIPSRMTIGHLIECLLGKVSVLEGREGDATPFNGVGVGDIGAALEALGYSADGTEKMYNGETGEEIPTRIFIGPTYYQRLKHMVADKEHSRGTGPVTKLTRQPLEGRSKEGGLRFGEMERDAVIGHGAANVLKDRMFYNSDGYRVHICKLCGMICQANLDKQRFLCRCTAEGNTTEVAQVLIPYACKLFFQELMAMNIAPRLKV